MTMLEGDRDRNRPPSRSNASDQGASSSSPGKRPLVTPVEGSSSDGPQGTPLTSDNLRTTMQTTRSELPRAASAVDPTLSDENAMLGEALNSAKLIYVGECERLRLKAPILAAQLPKPDAIGEQVEAFNAQIKNCVEITDSMGEEHWAEHSVQELQKGNTKERYIAERNAAERQKAASGWSQAAAKVVQLVKRKDYAAGVGLTLSQSITKQAGKKEGRDHNGRLNYFLMSTDTDDVMKSTGVDSTDTMTGRAQGAGSFADHLSDLFSGAACHKDARDTTDLLSHKIHGAPVDRTVASADQIPEVLAEIMAAVTTCPGPTKLLKLSVFNNHSMMFVVGERASKLETVAGQDSKSILVNDLIRSPSTPQDVRASINAGLQGLCRGDQPVALQYEVHQAASQETAEGRVHDKMRSGITQLGVGMAVGSWEMAGQHEAQQDALGYKDVPEDLEADHGVTAIAKREKLNVPERSARDGKLTFHELATPAVVSHPQAGVEYRVVSEGSWLRVKVDDIEHGLQPVWMYPMLKLTIVDVNPNLSQPVLPKSLDEKVALAMFNGKFKSIDIQDLKTKDLTDRVFTKHDGEQWVVTHDPGPGGGLMRQITLKKQ